MIGDVCFRVDEGKKGEGRLEMGLSGLLPTSNFAAKSYGMSINIVEVVARRSFENHTVHFFRLQIIPRSILPLSARATDIICPVASNIPPDSSLRLASVQVAFLSRILKNGYRISKRRIVWSGGNNRNSVHNNHVLGSDRAEAIQINALTLFDIDAVLVAIHGLDAG